MKDLAKKLVHIIVQIGAELSKSKNDFLFIELRNASMHTCERIARKENPGINVERDLTDLRHWLKVTAEVEKNCAKLCTDALGIVERALKECPVTHAQTCTFDVMWDKTTETKHYIPTKEKELGAEQKQQVQHLINDLREKSFTFICAVQKFTDKLKNTDNIFKNKISHRVSVNSATIASHEFSPSRSVMFYKGTLNELADIAFWLDALGETTLLKQVEDQINVIDQIIKIKEPK